MLDFNYHYQLGRRIVVRDRGSTAPQSSPSFPTISLKAILGTRARKRASTKRARRAQGAAAPHQAPADPDSATISDIIPQP
ncbi:uncharacterized protein PAN0_016d5237 [Moesziomyces antarcticus]|uniref:Uncharacterized protein n=2 Tax=Pseudozyma antarctica TaxID=84753 RepID=A0A081CK16_PSEA2|nr:uncharacterized protein PAN0_016d5237 [Moesziomyces antarcticus]GAK67012.1 hypothetical protein PAN0_016d5237 [Moesziomyces antarcticus]SPO48257.1 uncharacterized protein PSANT_05945 [Moesziomyces antarcticus]